MIVIIQFINQAFTTRNPVRNYLFAMMLAQFRRGAKINNRKRSGAEQPFLTC